MKVLKALVVEHDEKTRQVIDEILLAIGHRYEVATSLSEARELLTTNGYAYFRLNCMTPPRPGATPRRQNAENFLDDLRRLKGDAAPPVAAEYQNEPVSGNG
jgi:DNA-binding response OmpR family regulator